MNATTKTKATAPTSSMPNDFHFCAPMVRPLTTATRHRQVSDQEIQDIVITATLKPGKCLNFKSPFQVVRNKFGKDVQSSFLPFAFFAQIRPCERSADYWWKSPKRTQIDNHRLVYTKVRLSAASVSSRR
jgi:hypothetical protein